MYGLISSAPIVVEKKNTKYKTLLCTVQYIGTYVLMKLMEKT